MSSLVIPRGDNGLYSRSFSFDMATKPGPDHGRLDLVCDPVLFFLIRAAADRRRPGRRVGEGMSGGAATDRSLGRLAEAILVPPFPGVIAPGWLLAALDRGLAGVTLFGPNVSGPAQLAALTSQLRNAADEPVIAIDEEGGDVTRMAHRTGSLPGQRGPGRRR
jgi:hypothetical protein